MRKNYSELEKLFDMYMDNSLTEQDEQQLVALLNDSSMQKRWRLLSYLEGRLYEEASCTKSGVFERYASSLDTRYSSERVRNSSSPEVIRLPWYARVKYAALLMVGVLIATYFINENQYSQTEDIIRARLKEFYGKVEVERGGEVIPAENGMPFHSGDRINTRPQAQAVIQFDQEDTQVTVSENTDVRLAKEDKCKQITLTKGIVTCSVEKQSAESGLVVVTPHAEARVKGTRFAVEANDAQSSLRVLSGSVVFGRMDNNMEVEVAAGHEGVIRKDASDIVMHPSGMPGRGLVAYWPGYLSENQLLDMSGNHRHGIVNGGVKSTVGIMGSAIRLDGKTGYVSLNLPEQGGKGKPFTITMWVRSAPEDQKGRSALFSSVSKSQPQHSFQLDVLKKKGKLDLFRWNSAGGQASIGVVQPVWTHVAVTYDGRSIHTYHNSKLMRSEKMKQSPTLHQALLGVNRSGDRYFKGWIDEICVYNRALDPTELQQMVLIVGREKDRQTPRMKTAEDVMQYLSAHGLLTLKTGATVVRDRFKQLSAWRELGSFRSEKTSEMIRKLNDLLAGRRKTKNGFRNIRIKKIERNGKKETVMVLDGEDKKVVAVEFKQGITIGNGVEVTTNVFVEKPGSFFLRSFLFIHNGGWVQKKMFNNFSDFPVKQWFQLRSLLIPERDEAGHGYLTVILMKDDQPVLLRRMHCYSAQSIVYPYMYGVNGNIYVSDFHVRELVR